VEPALQLTGLSKRYGATRALDDVSFDVATGATHAIVGENGAGKSTLIRLLSGLQLPDTGTMRLKGKAYTPASLADSRGAGVSTGFQDLSLLPNLTIAENLFLPELGRHRPFVRRKENEEAAAAILSEYGLTHLKPRQQVESCSLADRQKLEIVRAISHQPRLLLLDEPSAALPDVEWLYGVLAKIASPELTILYISHRLAEIRDLCASATVLRNGHSVDTVRLADVDDNVVFRLMGGTAEGHGSHAGAGARDRVAGGCVIAVSGLRGHGVEDLSFKVHRGEIVGVAALEGQGQAETFKMLAGVTRPAGGRLEVDGKAVTFRSPAAAVRRGISFVPEERKTEGIFPGLSTLANVTVSSLKKGSTGGLIRPRKEYGESLDAANEVDLPERYLPLDIDALSGGNQQKAILARSLMGKAKLLLLYDPSRGVDVGTKTSIYELMRKFVSGDGDAILWYSTDLAELTGVCDRILCFYKGSVVAEMPGDGSSVESLLQAITGHGTAKETVR
jgi:ribose transport system ATP-binding protein